MSYTTYKSHLFGGVPAPYKTGFFKNPWFCLGLVALLATFLFPKISSAQIVANHLVISEIQIDGLAGVRGTEDDWVEIFNPTSLPVDVTGWSIQKTSATGGSLYRKELSGVIDPGGYYLIVRNHADTSAHLKSLADILAAATGFSLAVNNTVYLVANNQDITGSSDPDIVDMVGFGNAQNYQSSPALNPDEGGSLERVSSAGNNSVDFIKQPNPSPRAASIAMGPVAPQEPDDSSNPSDESGMTYSPPQDSNLPEIEPREEPEEQPQIGVPEIFITELVPNPAGTDAGNEWVELFNASNFEANISGWILDDAGSGFLPSPRAYTLPVNTTIPARRYKAFLIPKSKFALNNDGDTVRLFDADKSLVDQIFYTDKAVEGQSFAKDSAGNWRWTTMLTPGTPNQFPAPAKEDVKDAKKELSDYSGLQIVFNEVFVNPVGRQNRGKQWIEFLNPGQYDFDLSGWYLDDKGKTVTQDAYQIPRNTYVPAYGFLVIELPEEAFLITSTGDELRLISPDKVEQMLLVLPASPEGTAYARTANSQIWQITYLPTPGEENIFATRPRQVVFSEIYFRPHAGERAFIELDNLEDEWVDLRNWSLELAGKKYIFPAGAGMPPSSLLVLNPDALGFNVTASNWKTLKLLRPEGPVQDFLDSKIWDEGPIPAGHSLIVAGNRVQVTVAPTPGQPNQFARPVLEGNLNLLAFEQAALEGYNPVFEETTPLVAGEESAGGEAFEAENHKPIIFDKKQNKGFFHNIKNFLCKAGLRMIKCTG